MCKEDIRIARKYSVGTSTFSAFNEVDGILPANPNRVRVIAIQLYDATLPDPAFLTRLVAGPNRSGPTLFAFNKANPTCQLTVEEYGQALLGPLSFAKDLDTDLGTFYIFDLVLLEPLDEV